MPDLVANYLTIDPVTGEVGALFKGGVQLLAREPTTDPNDRSITWILDESHGADAGEIAGKISTGISTPANAGQFINLRTFDIAEANNVTLQAFCPDPGAPGQAKISYTLLGNGGAVEIGDIINDGGGSRFIKNVPNIGQDAITMEVGSVAVNFPGAATGTGTINHNLGGVPSGVVFGVQNSAAGNIVLARITFGATTITVTGTTNTGAAIGPGNVNCHWLAWRFV